MYPRAKLLWQYMIHYCTASNGKGHGIHSPFVFDFVTKVLNDDRHFYAYTQVENLRRILLADPRVKNMAQKLRPAKYGQMLFRTVGYYAPETVLELGTSLGIATAYMASANGAKVITVEEVDEFARSARANFEKLHLHNITPVQGNYETAIPETGKIDMVYIGEAYMPGAMLFYGQIKKRLHENSILVLEGIHTGKETEKVWEEIKQQPGVTLSIDLFHNGFVFFRKENKVRQDFAIRF